MQKYVFKHHFRQREKYLSFSLRTADFTDQDSHVSKNGLYMTRDPHFPFKFHEFRQSRVWKYAISYT